MIFHASVIYEVLRVISRTESVTFNVFRFELILNVFPLISASVHPDRSVKRSMRNYYAQCPGRIDSKHFYNSPKQIREISRLSGKFSCLWDKILITQVLFLPSLGTVGFYLKFFSFALREKRGGGG